MLKKDHLYTLLLFIVSSLIVILFLIFLFIYRESRDDYIRILSDRIIDDFQSALSYEMADLLSFSLALSEDGNLKNALITDDEERAYHIVKETTQRFKKYTHLKSLRLQVLTPDFFIFARSWGMGFEGMPLLWFREDLDLKEYNKEPKVGMETGRMLTFKATIPIVSGKDILGYLDVIKLVDEFATKLRKNGIELFALMDTRYLKQATLMRDFPYLHDFIISNQNFNRQLMENIQEIDWSELTQKHYLYRDNRLYLLEPMYNGKGKEIGKYLLILPEESIEKYKRDNRSMSLFTHYSDDDIRRVVASWSRPNDGFRDHYDRELVTSLPNLKNDIKKELEEEARDMLNGYEKSELIDIILQNRHHQKKRGEIK